jgi:hypothetical protein
MDGDHASSWWFLYSAKRKLLLENRPAISPLGQIFNLFLKSLGAELEKNYCLKIITSSAKIASRIPSSFFFNRVGEGVAKFEPKFGS